MLRPGYLVVGDREGDCAGAMDGVSAVDGGIAADGFKGWERDCAGAVDCAGSLGGIGATDSGVAADGFKRWECTSG